MGCQGAWTYLNYNLFFAADTERAVLQGRLNVDLDTAAYFNMSSAIYAFKKSVLGGRQPQAVHETAERFPPAAGLHPAGDDSTCR